MRKAVVFTHLFALLPLTLAWRPLQDHSRTSLRFLRATRDDKPAEIEVFRNRLEDTYLNHAGGDDFSADFFWENDAMLRPNDPDASRIQEYNDMVCEKGNCDDEDEQCDIPASFKALVNPTIDVMAFLGIRRAEPIQVNQQRLDDWE